MTFQSFASSFGLILDRPIADGRWHSCPTERKPKRKQGRYLWDGRKGVVGDFSSGVWEPYRGEESPVSLKEIAQLVREAKNAERKRWETARIEAGRIVAECERGTHPYLARKGFPTVLGLFHAPSGDLIIPMRECTKYEQINSVQRIGADGSKRFLPGGKAKGSVFRMGAEKGPTILVEGYVTGLSVLAGVHELRQQARVLVCFSASNLVYCSQFVRRPAFVFGDNDPTDVGLHAAIATGLPFAIWDQIGDANDLMLAKGIRAVAGLIREAQDRAAGYV